jgi:chemotaxis protein methyltransferase CheR
MINITDQEFNQLSQYIKAKYGIKLGPEKKALVLGRLRSVLAEKNFTNFTDYYNYVIADKTGDADLTLVNVITTNHTFFMREISHFHYFTETVLPYLSKSSKNKDMRVWSAGCSTGEEPYTLTMLINDFFGVHKQSWDTRILATDLSVKVLDAARKGMYRNEELAALPAKWRSLYFQRIDSEHSVISQLIKEEVIFRQFNLMSEVFPFKKKFHVIFCRNVMIYFDQKTKDELIEKFYEFTEPGGYLFIGHSESLNRENCRYQYIMPAVYRKERSI